MCCFFTHLHAAELADLRNGFTLRHDHHEVVGATTRLYMSADPAAGFVDVPTDQIEGYEPAPPDPQDSPAPIAKAVDLKAIVAEISARNKIDADFIASVIAAESANNPHAVSPKGAQGLMQLMPGTASKLGVKDSFDPEANVDGGVRYLRQLLSNITLTSPRRWPLTMPARSACSSTTAFLPTARRMPMSCASSRITTARSWPSRSNWPKPRRSSTAHKPPSLRWRKTRLLTDTE